MSKEKYYKMGSTQRSKLIAVIDEGTNSARFAIFKLPQFEELCSHQVSITQIIPHEGWSEQNPVELLEAVRLCAVEACHKLETLGYLVSDIASIGITNQRETTVAWDKYTGDPLYNAIVWNDIRTNSTVDKVLARIPDQNHNHFRQISGLPISPYFSALKLCWLKENVPAVRRACREKRCYAGTIDTWLIWNLTGAANGGVFVTDVTNASRTLLMNIETLFWDPILIKTFNLHVDMLPEIRSSSEIYGHIKYGSILDGLPVSAILGNQQASLIGQRCIREGQAKNTYRKGCFLLYNTGTRCVHSTHGLVTTLAYKMGQDKPAVYALEGSIAVAGVAMKWLRDNLGLLKDIPVDSEQIAGSVFSTGDVYFVPAFTGLFAPYWRKDARGIICGLTSFTTKHHIIRAALEAVCFQTRDIIEAMKKDCGINLTKLHADGVMTNNTLLMQLQADLVGIPVLKTEVSDPATLGTAMAAAQAKGIELYNMDHDNRDYTLHITHETFLPTTTEEERNARYTKWKMAVQRSLGWAVTKKSDAMTAKVAAARLKFPNYEARYINDFINYTRPAADIMEPIFYDYDSEPSRKAYNREYEDGVAGLGYRVPPLPLAMDPPEDSSTGTSATSQETEVTRPPDIYPDPDHIYATFLNKSTMKRNRFPGEENVIKVYSGKSLRKSPQARIDDDGSFDSLNNDMKGHDFIDNIMYIYYGTNGTLRKDLGGNVIVIGAVFALAPQILTAIILFLRNRRPRHFNTFYPICLNLLLTLAASNFSFVLGVQATRNPVKCELIAIVLHYLHLCTSIWCFIYIYVIYDLIVNECGPKLKYNYLMGYGVPAVYVLFSYASSIDTFEVHHYCWMSIQKGMIVSFMIPISFLIILTTVLGTISLKRISSKQTAILCESIESIIETTSKCNDIMFPRLPSVGAHLANRSNSYPQLELKEKCCQEYANQSMENRQSAVTLPQQTTGIGHGFSVSGFKKSLECYDTRIDLGQLSLAELSTPSLASDIQDFTEFKRAIKFGLFFQPIFSICWFLSVIALENMHSCVMPVIFAICLNILNWCMLVRSSSICPFVSAVSEETHEKSGLDCADSMMHGPNGSGGGHATENETTQASICTDTIPLLCASNPSIINATSGGLVPTPLLSRKCSTGSDLDQQTLNFISSNNLKNTWESSVDISGHHVNASDCISTISN